MSGQRVLWGAAWALAATAFAAGFGWLLSEQSDRAYWLSLPLCLPLAALLVARTPSAIARFPRALAWALAIPLWLGWAIWLLTSHSRTAWILGLLACAPILLLAYERWGESGEPGSSGGGVGGPPA